MISDSEVNFLSQKQDIKCLSLPHCLHTNFYCLQPSIFYLSKFSNIGNNYVVYSQSNAEFQKIIYKQLLLNSDIEAYNTHTIGQRHALLKHLKKQSMNLIWNEINIAAKHETRATWKKLNIIAPLLCIYKHIDKDYEIEESVMK